MAGTYYEDYTNNKRHCFLARLSSRGEYLASTYFYNAFPSAQQSVQYYSECNALTLTEAEEMIAVGSYEIATTGQISALILKSEYHNGDTVANELTTSYVVRLWATTNGN